MLSQIRTFKSRLGSSIAELDESDSSELLKSVEAEVRRQRPAIADPFAALPTDPRLLVELPDILVDLTRKYGLPEAAGFFRTISERAVERWVDFKPAERPIGAIDAIRDLNKLIDAGILLLDPGPVNSLWTVPEGEISDEMGRVITRVLDQVYGPSGGHVPCSTTVRSRSSNRPHGKLRHEDSLALQGTMSWLPPSCWAGCRT
jgi:hypothetical protein